MDSTVLGTNEVNIFNEIYSRWVFKRNNNSGIKLD